MGLREQILAANDVDSEIVHVAAWGVDVEVRGMSLAMRERIGDIANEAQQAAREGRDIPPAFSASVIIATAFDPETGEQLFTADDIPALNAKSAKALGELAAAGSRLSGLTDEAVTDAGKDSPSTGDDGSSSS